jgi:hypothetical protein
VRKKLDGWRALAADERWLLFKLAILLPSIGGALTSWPGLLLVPGSGRLEISVDVAGDPALVGFSDGRHAQ